MIYIYDILLNFCDPDVIYDFYEWNTSDNVENIKRIKLLHVERSIFDDLLYYDGVIDNEFLLKIYRTCEIYTSKKVKIVDYCCLFSDGDRVIAIEFDKDGKPMYKSKLLIDEEDEIAILASNLEQMNIKFNKKEEIFQKRFFTRNEMIIRKFLIKEIEDTYNKKKYEKLCFLYEEYFEKPIKGYKEMYNDLLDSLKTALDNKHKDMYQLLKLSNRKKQV